MQTVHGLLRAAGSIKMGARVLRANPPHQLEAFHPFARCRAVQAGRLGPQKLVLGRLSRSQAPLPESSRGAGAPQRGEVRALALMTAN